ncbi:MAG: hypothetical protein ACRDT6_11290 [Micromonosporaceae bacterium]
MHEILRERDITGLFRFLKTRGWSRAVIASAAGLSETRVRAICLGTQQVSSYEVLERIAAGFDIDRGLLGLAYADAAVAALPAVAGEPRLPDPSAYADFTGTLAALAVGSPPHDLDRMLPPPPPPATNVPRQVTAANIHVLREMSERHRRFDANLGGGACRESAVAYLRWAHGMLGSRFDSEHTERELKAALSDMYQVAGWACHDLGDHAEARRYLTAGLALAREIDDLVLIAGAFYRLGRVSIHQQRAREALTLWQLGQIVAQDSGCLAAVAVLHANEAWAYAMLGADERVADALARAEGERGRVDTAEVPSWAEFFLAPADIDGIASVIYNSLAAHEEHRSRYTPVAIDRAAAAFAHRRPGEDRSRAFDAISLAGGYLLDGQLEQAESNGHLAVDLTRQLASVRAVDRLGAVAELATPYAERSGIAAVVERISELSSE